MSILLDVDFLLMKALLALALDRLEPGMSQRENRERSHNTWVKLISGLSSK